MKVYTRGGDDGTTALFGGQRVSKTAIRVQAYGEVDELNALLGQVAAELEEKDLGPLLVEIQTALFDLGGELATPGPKRPATGALGDADVLGLEGWIDRLSEELPPLRNFILPGGTRAAALLHSARTVCRRAERATVLLAESEELCAVLIHYLNRLSDLLFVLARAVNRRAGVAETLWARRPG